jgi:single-stranded DNA-binding protein
VGNRIQAWGTIDGDVARKKVNDKDVSEFRLNDGKGWHSVVVWEQNDKVPDAGYVIVAGYSRTRSYEKDGSKRYVTEIVAQEIEEIGAPAEEKDDLFD